MYYRVGTVDPSQGEGPTVSFSYVVPLCYWWMVRQASRILLVLLLGSYIGIYHFQGRLWLCREMVPFVVIQISSLIAITC